MRRRKKIGILLLTETRNRQFAILQKRGKWNFFTGEHQTWPGICQVTCEGKINGPESPLAALIREIEEELGHVASTFIREKLLSCALQEQVIYTDDRVTTIGMTVPFELISQIRLEPITGGLIAVKRASLPKLVTAKDEWRATHHKMESGIVVFPEVTKALYQGFKLFPKKVKQAKEN